MNERKIIMNKLTYIGCGIFEGKCELRRRKIIDALVTAGETLLIGSCLASIYLLVIFFGRDG